MAMRIITKEDFDRAVETYRGTDKAEFNWPEFIKYYGHETGNGEMLKADAGFSTQLRYASVYYAHEELKTMQQLAEFCDRADLS